VRVVGEGVCVVVGGRSMCPQWRLRVPLHRHPVGIPRSSPLPLALAPRSPLSPTGGPLPFPPLLRFSLPLCLPPETLSWAVRNGVCLLWAVQKSAFEWGNPAYPHSAEAVQIMSAAAIFFVNEARKSQHSFRVAGPAGPGAHLQPLPSLQRMRRVSPCPAFS